MVKNKIIISGKARTGKNTLAEMLCAETHSTSEIEYKIFAFADPMKEMVMLMFPSTNPQVLWGPSELRSTIVPGETGKTYRDLLIEIGKLGRSYDPDIWINATIGSINKFLNKMEFGEISNRLAVCADCRFSNELNAVKNNDFVTIRIIRPNNDYIVDDVSEKDLDDVPDNFFNFIVVNDGTLEELKTKAKSIIAKLQ